MSGAQNRSVSSEMHTVLSQQNRGKLGHSFGSSTISSYRIIVTGVILTTFVPQKLTSMLFFFTLTIFPICFPETSSNMPHAPLPLLSPQISTTQFQLHYVLPHILLTMLLCFLSPPPKENDQCWRVRSRSCWQCAHSKAGTVGGIQAARRPSSVWTCAAIADRLISAPDKQEDTWCKSAIGRYVSMRYTAQPRMTISAAYIKWVHIEYVRECQLKYH